MDALQKVIEVGSLINCEVEALGQVLDLISEHLQSVRDEGEE